jgi:peroxiredoxin
MQDFYEPKVGDMAPDFRLPSTRGKEMSLKEHKGKDVILYFYPKDDTPGCTAEACSFRDHEADLTKEHAVVLGVSIDSLESHEKFRGKHDLNFPLLSDRPPTSRRCTASGKRRTSTAAAHGASHARRSGSAPTAASRRSTRRWTRRATPRMSSKICARRGRSRQRNAGVSPAGPAASRRRPRERRRDACEPAGGTPALH